VRGSRFPARTDRHSRGKFKTCRRSLSPEPFLTINCRPTPLVQNPAPAESTSRFPLFPQNGLPLQIPPTLLRIWSTLDAVPSLPVRNYPSPPSHYTDTFHASLFILRKAVFVLLYDIRFFPLSFPLEGISPTTFFLSHVFTCTWINLSFSEFYLGPSRNQITLYSPSSLFPRPTPSSDSAFLFWRLPFGHGSGPGPFLRHVSLVYLTIRRYGRYTRHLFSIGRSRPPPPCLRISHPQRLDRKHDRYSFSLLPHQRPPNHSRSVSRFLPILSTQDSAHLSPLSLDSPPLNGTAHTLRTPSLSAPFRVFISSDF